MLRQSLLPVLLMCLGVLGCSNDGPPKYTCTGTVTWEGQPLPEGYIVFNPFDNDFTDDAGPIKDGKFEFTSTAGKKRVIIDASRPDPSGKIDPAMGAVPRQAYIPERYNFNTILEADVKADGENKFNFPLTEKP